MPTKGLNTNQQLLYLSLIGGIIAGLASTFYLPLLQSVGQNPLGKYLYLSPPLYALFFAGAMWYFRDKLNGYRMKLSQGFRLGFFLNVFATILFYLGLYLYFNHTEMGQAGFGLYKSELLNILEASLKLDPERMTEQVYKETKMNIQGLSPSDTIGGKAFFFHFSGLFITLVMGMIFRHDPK